MLRLRSLSEMKKHVKDEHEDGKALHQLKIDRDDKSKVKFIYNLLSDLWFDFWFNFVMGEAPW